jgi:indole-3-glycerol phosphate synthase
MLGMADLQAIALDLDMAVLVEVHDRAEMQRALKLQNIPNKTMLGINNRDLNTFEVDIKTTISMLGDVPENKVLVTESGISTRDDVISLHAAGVQAYLVGEAFMRAREPGEALAELFVGI